MDVHRLLTLVDMFPFKFEIKEALTEFISEKFSQNKNETRSRANIYIFASYLSFLDYENKTEVLKAVKALGKDYYNVNVTKEHMDYLRSVPPMIFTNHMYDEEEFKLLEYGGLNIDRSTESKEVHKFLMSWLDKRPQIKKYIYPWLKDSDNFRYWTGIIASRAYRASLDDYERMRGIKFVDQPGGNLHKEMLGDILIGNFLF